MGKRPLSLGEIMNKKELEEAIGESMKNSEKRVTIMYEITLKQAIGKTIKSYDFSITGAQAVIVFDDNTFTTLGIHGEYESGGVELEQSTLEVFDFGKDKLITLGLFTQAECDKISNERFKDEQERLEKKQYLTLKRKYEN